MQVCTWEGPTGSHSVSVSYKWTHKYALLCVWFLLLKTMLLRFILFMGLAVVCSFFVVDQYPFVWICHNESIHSFVDEHLGCLQYLYIMNKAFVWTQVFISPGQKPGDGIAELQFKCMANFSETAKLSNRQSVSSIQYAHQQCVRVPVAPHFRQFSVCPSFKFQPF